MEVKSLPHLDGKVCVKFTIRVAIFRTEVCFQFVRYFRTDRLACTFVLAYWAVRKNGQNGSEIQF